MVASKKIADEKRPAIEPEPDPDMCLCKSIQPIVLLLKVLGMFPITTTHKDGYCVFNLSKPWLVWSCLMVLVCAVRIFATTELLNIFSLEKGKALHAILNAINDILYAVFLTLLTAINIFRHPRFIATLNSITPMMKMGLLCKSSLRAILKVQYVTFLVYIVILMAEYATLLFLHYSDNYLTTFTYKTYINRLTQNMTFAIYMIFISLSAIIMGMLGCFEKLATSCLNFEPVHPLKDVDETNNHAEFLGLIRYKICNEVHPCPANVRKLPSPEVVEFLRCLHEDISLIMYDVNYALNPQFLVHVVVELTVLIVHWYAVILYIAYEFTTPVAKTIHVLNVVFVTIHTLGLLTFLKHAQQLQNMIKGLTDFLLEYSTRVTLPEEHQQVRIFIQKLKVHRPLTASGVFTIDLGIAGPVCANILTYVLVALQFDVPKT